MKKLLTSLLATSILAQCLQAQTARNNPEQAQEPTSERFLPQESLRSKDAAMNAYRHALDVYNASELEKYIASRKVGDGFKDGEDFFASKDIFMVEISKRNKEKLQAYKDSLPRDGNYYVVEGDLLMTENEVASYLSATSRISEYKYLREGDWKVNIHDGEDDFYRAIDKRKLTYAVDKRLFTSQHYEQVVRDLLVASKSWQDACRDCGIEFTHLADNDLEPSHERVNFIVRQRDAKGVYLASAFFPHDVPERRYLSIDPLYFGIQSDSDRVGILEHQLGHVLGYLHVQQKSLAGCYFKEGTFLPLSRYAASSVMQFFCSGELTPSARLNVSDISFHRKLYGQPKLNTREGEIVFNAPNVLITQYQGGDVPGNIAAVIRELIKLNLIRVASHKVTGSTETVQTIYQSRLRVPVFSQAFADLAGEVNKGSLQTGSFELGKEVLYPDVEFREYEQILKLDPESKQDKEFESGLEANKLVVNKSGKAPVRLVTVRAYELRLALESSEKLKTAFSHLVSFISRANISNVLVSYQGNLDSSPGETNNSNSPTEKRSSYFATPARASGIQTLPNFQEGAATPATPREDEQGSQVQEVYGFLSALDSGGVKVGAEGGLRFVTKTKTLPQSLEPYRCKPEVNCPDVILVDTEVYAHPDLQGAYKKSYSTADKVSTVPDFTEKFTEDERGRQKIKLTTDDPSTEEHGTFMAGIIASRANGYGIVGMDPNAQIYSFNWEVFKDNPVAFTELLEERDYNGRVRGKQIVVFATKWRLHQDLETTRVVLNREADRWTDRVAQFLKASTLVVIAAIGQPEKNEEDKRPKEIDPRFIEGPMNLGDLENVIIVTACEDCYGQSPRLLSTANVPAKNAENMVHIAAPGVDIPGPVKPLGRDLVRYAKGNGTSPATALVAGVVSQMISYWPDAYKNAADVKRRIQVTARPTVVDGGLLPVGFLDPAAALLDPAKHHSNGQSLGNFCWDDSRIEVRNIATNKKTTIYTENILRIHRINSGKNVYWVFYTKTDSRSVIARQGPFFIDPKHQDATLLIESQNGCDDPRGAEHKLKDITDLLLSDVNDKVAQYPPIN